MENEEPYAYEENIFCIVESSDNYHAYSFGDKSCYNYNIILGSCGVLQQFIRPLNSLYLQLQMGNGT